MLCGQAECFHIEWVFQDLEKLQGTRAASQIGSCKPEQSIGAEESQHQELQSEHGGKEQPGRLCHILSHTSPVML